MSRAIHSASSAYLNIPLLSISSARIPWSSSNSSSDSLIGEAPPPLSLFHGMYPVL